MNSEDLKDTQYIDVIWLQTFGLHKNNVLDYFATSPFFDRNSNNQTLINQGLGMEFLTQMTGLEFNVSDSTDPANRLFVINKCKRENPQKTIILEIYYILDGIIYQSPMFLEQVRSRVAKASFHLLDCYKLIQQYQQLDDSTTGSVTQQHDADDRQLTVDNIDTDRDNFNKLHPFTNTLSKLT